MKKVSLTLLGILLLVLLTGCNTEKFNNPDLIQKMLDKTTETTEQAIEKKDIKIARNLWAQISELGIKVDESGEKKLAESIGKMASTYVYLVDYIEKNDDIQLKIFNEKFGQAIDELKEQVDLLKKRARK